MKGSGGHLTDKYPVARYDLHQPLIAEDPDSFRRGFLGHAVLGRQLQPGRHPGVGWKLPAGDLVAQDGSDLL
jgi:hypothetical protein